MDSRKVDGKEDEKCGECEKKSAKKGKLSKEWQQTKKRNRKSKNPDSKIPIVRRIMGQACLEDSHISKKASAVGRERAGLR